MKMLQKEIGCQNYVTSERAERREAKREVKLSAMARESFSTTSMALKISVCLNGGFDLVESSRTEQVGISETVEFGDVPGI